MAWSWSHTDEAYENALSNFKAIDSHEMGVIAAEWDADEVDGFNNDIYLKKFKEYESGKEVNLSDLWDKISGQRTCDNGGFNAWVCPFGCHTVPFDLQPS